MNDKRKRKTIDFYNDRICVFVIQNPNNKDPALDTLNHCVEQGFKHVFLSRGIEGGRSATDEVVSACHIKAISEYLRHDYHKRNWHLLILEDDCRFEVKDAFNRVAKAVHMLDVRIPNWHTLHVGHVPLGPCFPILKSDSSFVVWTSLPFSGHCYVINCVKASNILPKKMQWKRPFSMEGLLHLPIFSRFALNPSIATQIRRPKELVKLDNALFITKGIWFEEYTILLEIISLVLPIIVLVLIVKGVRKLTSSNNT